MSGQTTKSTKNTKGTKNTKICCKGFVIFTYGVLVKLFCISHAAWSCFCSFLRALRVLRSVCSVTLAPDPGLPHHERQIHRLIEWGTAQDLDAAIEVGHIHILIADSNIVRYAGRVVARPPYHLGWVGGI